MIIKHIKTIFKYILLGILVGWLTCRIYDKYVINETNNKLVHNALFMTRVTEPVFKIWPLYFRQKQCKSV